MSLRSDLVAENNQFENSTGVLKNKFGECTVFELNIKSDKTAKLFSRKE